MFSNQDNFVPDVTKAEQITLPYSSTFYSLLLPLFVLEIFKFKYVKFSVRHSASMSNIK